MGTNHRLLVSEFVIMENIGPDPIAILAGLKQLIVLIVLKHSV